MAEEEVKTGEETPVEVPATEEGAELEVGTEPKTAE